MLSSQAEYIWPAGRTVYVCVCSDHFHIYPHGLISGKLQTRMRLPRGLCRVSPFTNACNRICGKHVLQNLVHEPFYWHLTSSARCPDSLFCPVHWVQISPCKGDRSVKQSDYLHGAESFLRSWHVLSWLRNPYVLWNPSPIPFLSQINPVHASPSEIFKIRFNIIFPSTLRSSKWCAGIPNSEQRSSENQN